MFYVVTLIIEEATVDEMTGPFGSAGEAMSWIDQDVRNRQGEEPELALESSDEVVTLTGEDEEGTYGFLYQIVAPKVPTTVIIEAEPV